LGLLLGLHAGDRREDRRLDAASRFEARPSDEEMEAVMSAREMEPLFV
jgi:hypothetical protein